MSQNAFWFKTVAGAIRSIVDDCGGAILMTREELVSELELVIDNLQKCPQDVLNHLLLPLRRRQGLSCTTFDGVADVFLIFDRNVHATSEKARIHCEKMRKLYAVQVKAADQGLTVRPQPILA